jgi:DNA polymerase
MTSPRTSPRNAYLAWQAEMGTEEVVLTTPWVRPAARVNPAASAARPAESPGGSNVYAEVPPHSPRYSTQPAGPEFFGAIAEKLAKPATPRGRVPAKASSENSATAGSVTSPSPLTAAMSQTGNLDEYWKYLEAEYPRWYPGAAAPLTRALGHASPRLAVVELSPSSDGLFAGEAGVFFDKMMNAIGLTRDQMYLTSVMKTSPPGSPGKPWARKDVARMVPALLRELVLARCGLVLLLGETCAQVVLRTGRTIPGLLKAPEEAEGLSLSATWHPDELLKSGNDTVMRKAAWDHLQWLQGLLPARGS